MHEIWLPIRRNIGLYSVSDLGNIYSEKRDIVLKPQPNSKGYLRVTLSNREQAFIHHLVLEHFEGPRPEGLWVLHRDDDHSRNMWSNLYYGTPSQNMADMINNGNHYLLNRNRCINGHEFTPENTIVNNRRGSKTMRNCRECGRKRSRDYMRRKAHEAKDLQLNSV